MQTSSIGADSAVPLLVGILERGVEEVGVLGPASEPRSVDAVVGAPPRPSEIASKWWFAADPTDAAGSESLAQFAALCSAPALFAQALQDRAEALARAPAAQRELEVELLIRAHACFAHASALEGVASCMEVARRRAAVYAREDSHRCLVRLFTGFRKFREMSYIIDMLIAADQFEQLLRRGRMRDEQTQLELQLTLRDHLLASLGLRARACVWAKAADTPRSCSSRTQRHYPNDTERLHMVHLHFNMLRDIGASLQEQVRRLMRACRVCSSRRVQREHRVSLAQALERLRAVGVAASARGDATQPFTRSELVELLYCMQVRSRIRADALTCAAYLLPPFPPARS